VKQSAAGVLGGWKNVRQWSATLSLAPSHVHGLQDLKHESPMTSPFAQWQDRKALLHVGSVVVVVVEVVIVVVLTALQVALQTPPSLVSPSSQTSPQEPSTMPLPHALFELQRLLQPSQKTVLPSSQTSGAHVKPSPHEGGLHAVLQASQLLVLPSSHCSPA